ESIKVTHIGNSRIHALKSSVSTGLWSKHGQFRSTSVNFGHTWLRLARVCNTRRRNAIHFCGLSSTSYMARLSSDVSVLRGAACRPTGSCAARYEKSVREIGRQKPSMPPPHAEGSDPKEHRQRRCEPRPSFQPVEQANLLVSSSVAACDQRPASCLSLIGGILPRTCVLENQSCNNDI